VLNLPSESLSKEVQLTQAIIELFAQHQIPSHYLCVGPWPPSSEANESETVAVVRGHVVKMQGLLKANKVDAELTAGGIVSQQASVEAPRGSRDLGPAEAHPSPGTHSLNYQNHNYRNCIPSSGLITPTSSHAFPILGGTDFWRFPARVERQCEHFGCDDVLHPTIITATRNWIKHSPSSPGKMLIPWLAEIELLKCCLVGLEMDEKTKRAERIACFHLLDALSKSGRPNLP